MKKLTAALILFFIAVPCFGADSHSALLETAESSFVAGNYRKTIEIYEILAQIEKINDPYIYYNLSNAYYRSGDLGKAVLNIERAFLLQTGDKDIGHNRTFLIVRAGAAEPEGFDKFLNSVRETASLNTVSVLFAATGISVLILFSLYLIKRKKYLRNAVIILFAAFAVFSVWTALKIKYEIYDIKAVALKSAAVRSGPGTNNPEIFNLNEGRIVSVSGENGGWNYITIYPEVFSGWIESAAMEKING